MGNAVMVVDDDAEIREVLAMVVSTEGLEPITACSGEDALSQLHQGAHPRVILVDLMMPGMTGAELLDALRSDPQTAMIPVVIVSGDAHAAETARSLGVAGCLMKPVELDHITKVLRRFA